MKSEHLPSSLTDKEAAQLLLSQGANELPQEIRQGALKRILRVLSEPMLLLLLVAAGIYLVMGDLTEGILLCASVLLIVGISIYQDHKSENALAKLKELSSPRALVIRDGIEKRIPARELVTGDLIALHEGDRVPADCEILQASHLRIDESLLTGESFPVLKGSQDAKVFSSTLVVGGTALARVTLTGSHTEVGKIGKRLSEAEAEPPTLSLEIRRIVRLFAWTGSLICLAIILLYGFLLHEDQHGRAA